MNKKELYIRRNYTARRGGYYRRKNVPLFKEQDKRREFLPKWSKWGNVDFRGEAAIHPFQYETDSRRAAHDQEKAMNRNRKNFRRTQHAIKDKRGYWKPTLIRGGKERKKENL